MKIYITSLLFLLLFTVSIANAATTVTVANNSGSDNESNYVSKNERDKKTPFVENSLFSFRLIPRSPEQMAAFYEARGFPKSATNLIEKTCYFTAIVRNKSDKVIWLDLKYWRFYDSEIDITRIDRTYWNKRWQQINLKQSYRSTFWWTLLPEKRGLLPNEHVGGNIALPKQEDSFTVSAIFISGKNKRGSEIRAELKNISCKNNEDTAS